MYKLCNTSKFKKIKQYDTDIIFAKIIIKMILKLFNRRQHFSNFLNLSTFWRDIIEVPLYLYKMSQRKSFTKRHETLKYKIDCVNAKINLGTTT